MTQVNFYRLEDCLVIKFPTSTVLSSHGLSCYRKFDKAFCLQVSERQRNDYNDYDQEYFIAMLKRLREGILDDTITCEDWNFILKNQVTPAKLKDFDKGYLPFFGQRIVSRIQFAND